MKKQLLILALTIGMLTAITAQSAYYNNGTDWQGRPDEGGVTEVAATPFRTTGDALEGTGKVLTGRWSRNADATDWQGRPDEGGVEELVKTPFRTAGDAVEGTGKILTGNWF